MHSYFDNILPVEAKRSFRAIFSEILAEEILNFQEFGVDLLLVFFFALSTVDDELRCEGRFERS